MTLSCDSCGRSVALGRVYVLAKQSGYRVLGPCCRHQFPRCHQYEPRDPGAAVERIRAEGSA